MTDYGVTVTGFVRKPYEVIVEELRSAIRAQWGTAVNLAPDSLLGQIVDTTALKIAEQWEVSEAAYAAADPDQAEGAALDAVAAITGTEREAATKTKVLASVNVDPGTYAIGALIAHVSGNPAARFANAEEVVNAGAVAETITGVEYEAETTGPTPALAGTLTVIASAVGGWNSITNVTDDYSRGAAIELDAPLRARREEELGSQGSTNVDAIRADVLRVAGVLRATVLENVTDTTDGNGLLPHSIEVIVYGPTATDADIADAIFQSKAGGGANTNGTTTVLVTDEQGFDHSIKFTRPTVLQVFAYVELAVNALYAGGAAVKAQLAGADAGFGPGEALLWTQLICQPYEVAGVTKVLDFGLALSGAGPFLQQDITPTIRQVVSLDSADVEVVVP